MFPGPGIFSRLMRHGKDYQLLSMHLSRGGLHLSSGGLPSQCSCRCQGILLKESQPSVSKRLFSLASQLVYPPICCYEDQKFSTPQSPVFSTTICTSHSAQSVHGILQISFPLIHHFSKEKTSSLLSGGLGELPSCLGEGKESRRSNCSLQSFNLLLFTPPYLHFEKKNLLP